MIESASGDILKADVDALVNPVNCEGETGRGLALQFKTRFPENFDAYYQACRDQAVQLGKMFVYETAPPGTRPRFVVNFPVKHHWRDPITLETIQAGLVDLSRILTEKGIVTLAMPPIGCGPGGLDWRDVRPLLERHLDQPDKHIVIYGFSAPPIQKAPARPQEPPSMTRGRAALVHLMARYVKSINDNHVTLPELHMLLYLLQEAGETLRLEFNKGSTSPYARNLRPVLNAIDGYYLSGYIGGPDRPSKELVLIPAIEPVAEEFLAPHTGTLRNIDRVLDLVEGFEPHAGLELVSSTHWIVAREQSRSLDDVIRRSYGWNRQKRRFPPERFEAVVNKLVEGEWIDRLSGSGYDPHLSRGGWASDPADDY